MTCAAFSMAARRCTRQADAMVDTAGRTVERSLKEIKKALRA